MHCDITPSLKFLLALVGQQPQRTETTQVQEGNYAGCDGYTVSSLASKDLVLLSMICTPCTAIAATSDGAFLESQPVSLTSLGLTAVTGVGLLYYFQHLQEQKVKGQPCLAPAGQGCSAKGGLFICRSSCSLQKYNPPRFACFTRSSKGCSLPSLSSWSWMISAQYGSVTSSLYIGLISIASWSLRSGCGVNIAAKFLSSRCKV